MFSALMKSVVLSETKRVFFEKVHNLPVQSPTPHGASTQILPQQVPKHAATAATRKKRKADDVEADVVKTSKKVKTEQPKQQLEAEGLWTKKPAKQSNPDVGNKTKQSYINIPPSARKIMKIRNEHAQKKKKAAAAFHKLRDSGRIYSNPPAEKWAGRFRPPVPLFPKGPTEAVPGAVDQKDIPAAHSPSQASSNGKATVAGVLISPESVLQDQKTCTVPDVATPSNVENQNIFKRIIASGRRKRAAAATSAEIRSWMSPKPNRILSPKNVGSCDKWRLPGTDTKLLPCHLTQVLESKTWEPMSAADRKTVKAALASRKDKKVKKVKKTDDLTERIRKTLAEDKRKRREKKKLRRKIKALLFHCSHVVSAKTRQRVYGQMLRSGKCPISATLEPTPMKGDAMENAPAELRIEKLYKKTSRDESLQCFPRHEKR
ncbi:MAG: hypothetical protein Q9195_001195 [Heterodermia aff. obscurata]